MSETALSEGCLIAGRYRLEQPLGEGGMGAVWAATHTVTRRSVALKFLREAVRHRQDLRERFLREAMAASALTHPNVVEIIDVFDFAESSPVLVMELLRGETLGARLQREERLSLEQTAALLLPVVSAVGAAHSLGIVHRDLKPENLFLLEGTAEPRVKVLDFGIAKLSAERYLQDGAATLLTESGAVLGTPCYMAPEQASGDQPVDQRADIWSLGVILYECLTGMRPIEGENLPQVVARLMSAGIMPIERLVPGLPAEVSSLAMRLLTRDAERRPGSVREVFDTLRRFTPAPAPELPPPSVALPTPVELPLVATQGVDPQGLTLLSAPPLQSSLLPLEKAERRRAGVYAAAAAGLLLAMVGAWWTRGRIEPLAQPLQTELPIVPQRAFVATAPPVVEPQAAPTAVASAAVVPVSVRRARTKMAVAVKSRPEPTDDDMFPGRK